MQREVRESEINIEIITNCIVYNLLVFLKPKKIKTTN